MVSAPTQNPLSTALNTPSTSQVNSGNQQISNTDQYVSQDDFMSLLVAQLENQDPLNPMENTDFIAELATFSSLEQETNQTALLEEMVNGQQNNATNQALSLMGQEITSSNTTINHVPGQTSDFMFQSPGPGQYAVSVFDQQGNLAMTDVTSADGAGNHSYTFDGMNGEGQSLPPGQYTIRVGASMNQNGEVNSLPTFMQGEVEGVNFLEGKAVLMVNGQPVPMDSVQAVYQPENG